MSFSITFIAFHLTRSPSLSFPQVQSMQSHFNLLFILYEDHKSHKIIRILACSARIYINLRIKLYCNGHNMWDFICPLYDLSNPSRFPELFHFFYKTTAKKTIFRKMWSEWKANLLYYVIFAIIFRSSSTYIGLFKFFQAYVLISPASPRLKYLKSNQLKKWTRLSLSSEIFSERKKQFYVNTNGR